MLRDPWNVYVGLGDPRLGTGATDPSVYMWFLVWWPHAITHSLNPLNTQLLWAPYGANLAWTTNVPGAALMAWPFTALMGPIGGYDFVMIVAPALAAWAAYLLCRHLTGAPWPSWVGGYLFGFSSYELAQMTAHLNLSLVFPVPLVVLLILRRVEGGIRPLPFVWLLSGLIVLQFSFSPEVLFTTTLFGAMALLLAVGLVPKRRRAILEAAGWAGPQPRAGLHAGARCT